MRTTLDIDADVLAAAKEIARRERRTAGEVITDLTRRALAGTAAPAHVRKGGTAGFRPFASRGAVITNDLIDRLRDESGA